jgi:hypothetical protein
MDRGDTPGTGTEKIHLRERVKQRATGKLEHHMCPPSIVG